MLLTRVPPRRRRPRPCSPTPRPQARPTKLAALASSLLASHHRATSPPPPLALRSSLLPSLVHRPCAALLAPLAHHPRTSLLPLPALPRASFPLLLARRTSLAVLPRSLVLLACAKRCQSSSVDFTSSMRPHPRARGSKADEACPTRYRPHLRTFNGAQQGTSQYEAGQRVRRRRQRLASPMTSSVGRGSLSSKSQTSLPQPSRKSNATLRHSSRKKTGSDEDWVFAPTGEAVVASSTDESDLDGLSA